MKHASKDALTAWTRPRARTLRPHVYKVPLHYLWNFPFTFASTPCRHHRLIAPLPSSKAKALSSVIVNTGAVLGAWSEAS